jgi:hypothetical protein
VIYLQRERDLHGLRVVAGGTIKAMLAGALL